jgi:hypothetical protein
VEQRPDARRAKGNSDEGQGDGRDASGDFGTKEAIVDTAGGGSYTESLPTFADPQFIDPMSFDFHIGGGSPAVDAAAGDSAPDQDFACAPRPTGAGYDIGAYEAQ